MILNKEERVHVTVPALISLNQNAKHLLPANTIRAQQSGQYLSPFKGRGMEFDEVRPYQAGDDLIKQLVKMQTQETSPSATNPEAIQAALARLRRVVRPGSLIFLISDFRYLNVQAESHLIQIAKHNEVVMLFIYDPLESQLPPSGRYRLSDGKSDITVNTAEQERVIKYHKRFEQHQAYLQKLLNRHRFLTCATTDDPIKILQGGFRLRV
jgi:hypothetical protein